MMSLDIRNKKKKRFYFSPENEEVPENSENINPQEQCDGYGNMWN